MIIQLVMILEEFTRRFQKNQNSLNTESKILKFWDLLENTLKNI